MLIKLFSQYFQEFLSSRKFFFLFFVLILSFYVRLDAELMIFLSVVLVIFTVWSSLSDFLGTILMVRSAFLYLAIIRYYQARMWLIYMSYKVMALNLYSNKLPFFFKWYRLYSKRIYDTIVFQGENLSDTWNRLNNLYVFLGIKSTMVFLWISFYDFYISLFFSNTLFEDLFTLNIRKLSEYCILNEVFLTNNLDI